MRKEYILPLVTAWMNLEYTMLSKTRQTKTSTAQHHLYAESTEIKRVKKTTTYKRTPNRLSADFSTETLQATMEREEPTTKNTLPSKTLLQIWWRNQKLSRQAKIKRIQHHQTSFTTNAKGTSLGRKHKRGKRPTENKAKTIQKMVVGPYISIIILNVNGLNAPTKRHRLTGCMKTCACMHFYLPHDSAWSPALPQIACILYC